MNKEIETVLNTIITLADEKKATDIRAYHFQENAWIVDVAVVMSVSNTVHCRALIQTFKDSLGPVLAQNPTEFYEHPRQTGDPESGWIILDLNAILIHCIQDDLRAFYTLDKAFEKRAIVYHH